ncbi:hypothetical protein AAFF_G00252440 [Aldrovandia affinis]|uniref:Uncharacterized protein n=1 Tax=Aldrovandia affinis TaxID=143900 RepID=A0AAD7STL4_9TELE|nr:hypothetical protein AAFF_G00252440 [Aldrovandia affinis]
MQQLRPGSLVYKIRPEEGGVERTINPNYLRLYPVEGWREDRPSKAVALQERIQLLPVWGWRPMRALVVLGPGYHTSVLAMKWNGFSDRIPFKVLTSHVTNQGTGKMCMAASLVGKYNSSTMLVVAITDRS